MARVFTAIGLGVATLWCAFVEAFFLQVNGKFGSADLMIIGLMMAFLAPVVAMWLAFSRGRLMIAGLIAATPLIATVVLLSMVKTRLF